MTKSKEAQEQEELAQQEQQAQEQRQRQQGGQIRTGGQGQQGGQDKQGSQPTIQTNPNNVNVAANQQTAASEHVQTIANVTPPTREQTATDPQNTISQNIEGDAQAHHTNEQLRLLKRIVGLASPIVEDQEETEEQKDADGNVVQIPVTKKVTTGYSYYAINGQKFEDWIQTTFGGDISIDTKENKITYNKPIEEIQAAPVQEQQEEAAKQASEQQEGNK